MKPFAPLLAFLLLFAAAQPATAQKGSAERRIAAQKREIEAIEKRIAEEEQRIAGLRKGRASAEEKARLLARQLESRNELLGASQREEALLMDEVARTDSTAGRLSGELQLRRTQYAGMVCEAYRNYRFGNYLTYLFSARDFRDAARRIASLRAVASLRARQMERIDSLGLLVSAEREVLAARQRSLDSVRRSLTSQKERLQRDAAAARANIRQLSKREQEALKKKIEEEQRREGAVAELRKLAKGNKQGATFSTRTSNLRLPVVGGTVKRYKGNMAEIAGPRGAQVISIYEGRVADIKRNRITNKYDIYIAHGEYIASYANLASAAVEKGQTVARNQTIGTVGTSVDVLTMETQYKIVFGIYPPSPDVKMNAADCFKK